MNAKRGDRAAPPPRPGGFEVRFDNTEAAKGWEELCQQAPGNMREAFERLEANPRPAVPTGRQHPLKYDRATAMHRGRPMPQWQYEVTGAARIWYLVDEEALTCWVTHASTGHPKATE